MITPVILGADFWSRIPPITLDFTNLYDNDEIQISYKRVVVRHQSEKLRRFTSPYTTRSLSEGSRTTQTQARIARSNHWSRRTCCPDSLLFNR